MNFKEHMYEITIESSQIIMCQQIIQVLLAFLYFNHILLEV